MESVLSAVYMRFIFSKAGCDVLVYLREKHLQDLKRKGLILFRKQEDKNGKCQSA